jgi:excisionase family DNA binding protein
MEYLSIDEAAQGLRVSPRRVRQLLADGSLQGLRIGGRWLVSPTAIERRRQSTPPPGRPLSSGSAWQVLAALSQAEDGLERLSPPLRSRARSRATQLREQPVEAIPREWRSALRRRAELHQFYGHPSVLADLLNDPKIVQSGISAAHHHGADLMVVGGAEGYLRSQNLSSIVEYYALSPALGPDANVWLHVVDTGADWLFRRDLAPRAVVAADLLEHDGVRDRAAGVKLVAAL